jgi:hypothetical protein
VKKELKPGVVIGVLAVVVVVAALLLWKAVAPPGPTGIKPFDKASLKVMEQKHAESAQEIQQQQMKLYQQIHGGGH